MESKLIKTETTKTNSIGYSFRNEYYDNGDMLTFRNDILIAKDYTLPSGERLNKCYLTKKISSWNEDSENKSFETPSPSRKKDTSAWVGRKVQR